MHLNRPLILASTSPRRKFLLQEIGFQFQIKKPAEDETFPDNMIAEQVPSFLAEKKANAFKKKITRDIVIASDTVVILGNKILNKPVGREDAIQMLSSLSGRTHTVITAVCLVSREKEDLFDDRTLVTFKKLRVDEIETYVDQCKPYDKAGAYGAQECLPKGVNPCSREEIEFLERINKVDLVQKSMRADTGAGMVGIEKIEGSYFTVMGFPIHKVYEHLVRF